MILFFLITLRSHEQMRVKTNIKVGNKIQNSIEQAKDILKLASDTLTKPRVIISELIDSPTYKSK